MIRTVAIQGYRSLRELVLPLGNLTVTTGVLRGDPEALAEFAFWLECSLGAVLGIGFLSGAPSY
jgi:hypothetical protein